MCTKMRHQTKLYEIICSQIQKYCVKCIKLTIKSIHNWFLRLKEVNFSFSLCNIGTYIYLKCDEFCYKYYVNRKITTIQIGQTLPAAIHMLVAIAYSIDTIFKFPLKMMVNMTQMLFQTSFQLLIKFQLKLPSRFNFNNLHIGYNKKLNVSFL